MISFIKDATVEISQLLDRSVIERDLGFVNESICVTLLEVSADNLARDIVVDVCD